jgi:NADH-quinone oxidoreductase subunit J
MVLCTSPIHSVLFFILIFFCSSLVFTLLHSDFIGLLFLMVYVGAIAVLFVFVVMMLNIKRVERDNTTYLLVGGFISFIFSMQLVYVAMSSLTILYPTNVLFNNTLLYDSLMHRDEFMTKYFVQMLGYCIFILHPVVLFFSGVTLLVSLIGSIYLTNTKSGYSRRSQYNQLFRNSKLFRATS